MRRAFRCRASVLLTAVLLAAAGYGSDGEPAPASPAASPPAAEPTGRPLTSADIQQLAAQFTDNPLTGGHIRIDVTDTGLGICQEDQPPVFDRFYRGRNASAATGTGLGLAIAAWIVGQHHGTITLDSTPHVGSRFSVLLPLEEPN